MFVEIIQDALMIGLIVGRHLLQIILAGVEIVLLAGSPDPSAEREIHGAKNFRGGIGLLDHRGILLAEADDRVVIGLVGLDVAMGVAPAAWFIVELIIGDATVRGCAECRDEMLHPALLQGSGVINVIGVNVVVEQLHACGSDAIAAVVAVGMHVGVGGLLRSVHGNGETAGPR